MDQNKSSAPTELPDDRTVPKVVAVAPRTDNKRMSATLRVRVARLCSQAFGAHSETVEREIAQLGLALEDLQVAVAEGDDSPTDESEDAHHTASDAPEQTRPQRRSRVTEGTPRERRGLDPGETCPDSGGAPGITGQDMSEPST
ncbi:transposase [Paralimibaculum aggregatum]|nr:transposase [Limibaculum sp. NKW23]